MICEDKETNDNWKKNNKMILSASAFNSCMIEFSIPDFNETIIKNIISLFLSFWNTERREVVFRTLCSSVSTVVNGRGEGTVVGVLYLHFMTAYYYCIPQTLGKSRQFLIFRNNHRRQSKVLFFLFFQRGLSISSLFFDFYYTA